MMLLFDKKRKIKKKEPLNTTVGVVQYERIDRLSFFFLDSLDFHSLPSINK